MGLSESSKIAGFEAVEMLVAGANVFVGLEATDPSDGIV